MAKKQWMDNAFWETDEKNELNCILELIDDVGRETRQVMKLKRTGDDGLPNELFEEVVDTLGEESIDKNTVDRRERKKAEAEEKKRRDLEHNKARKLEVLFNHKLELFEIDQIKDSKNRALKGKIRRAKSRIEADMYAMELVKYENELAESAKDESGED